MKTNAFSDLMEDPLRNAAILAPVISLTMSMNVMIGPIRFFIPDLAANLQALMAPALLFWLGLWAFVMALEVRLLKTSFENSFDVSKISFGWLLHPFALGMLTVVGTGIAAMSQDATVAHTAAFFSLVSGSMGTFLLTVKLIAIFKSHFAADGLPDRQFLPSFLIVVPNITLFAISAFRFAHYLENHLGFEAELMSFLVIAGAFAFETWYMIFGISLLSDYFRKYFFNGEFYVTQWGLICPVVAYGVLGSFFFSVFAQNPVVYLLVLATIVAAVLLFAVLLRRQGACSGWIKGDFSCI